jgi:hypothetical protein
MAGPQGPKGPVERAEWPGSNGLGQMARAEKTGPMTWKIGTTPLTPPWKITESGG